MARARRWAIYDRSIVVVVSAAPVSMGCSWWRQVPCASVTPLTFVGSMDNRLLIHSEITDH